MRITFDVSDETHTTLCLIPHGMRRYAYKWLLEAYAEYLRTDPASALKDLLEKHIDMRGLMGGTLGKLMDGEKESSIPS